MLRTLLAVVVLVLASPIGASVGAEDDLTSRARAWLGSLDASQRARATLAFEDADRRNWHYVPRSRRGLAFGALRPHQRAGALALLDVALSSEGARKARGVFALERVLRDRLPASVRQRSPGWRDPGAFHVAVFGTPSTEGRWGLRIEGHHLSVNVTVEDGRATAATPLFFGANPTRARTQGGADLRPLGREEDLARELFTSLDREQRAAALVSNRAPGDVVAGPGRIVRPSGRGLPVDALDALQRERFYTLVATYVESAAPSIARAAMAEVRATAPSDLRFLWLGADAPGRPHAYRIEGPTIFLEYVNRGDHIHVVWRDPRGDFGVRR